MVKLKQRHVPIKKQSKRAQREQHAKRRGKWGAINPITRKAPNPKAYKRRKPERWLEDEPNSGFFVENKNPVFDTGQIPFFL